MNARSSAACRRSGAVGALLFAVLLAVPARAQWSADPAQNLTVAARPAGQTQPKLVPTVDGGFYVSWFGGGGDGYDVYLQRLDATGTAQWADGGVRVADRALSSTQDYGLATDAEGHALLAFGTDDAGGVLQAVANRVSPAGEVLWGASGRVVSADASGAASPRIAGLPGGAVVVAWTSFETGALVLQKLDAAGAPQWGPDGVELGLPTGTFFLADLHADADGNVIVSGSAQLSFSSRRLWAQKLAAADGAPLWGAQPVEVFDGSDGALQLGYFPPFVPDGAGGAVFAWYQVSGAATARVRVQHVRADGTLAFPPNGVEAATGAARNRYAPSAAYDAATGSVYVVWPEETANPRRFAVSAQRISDAGVRLWGDAGRELVPLGDQQASQVSALPMPGGAVFAWALGSAPDPTRIEATRLDSAGTPVWPAGRVALKTAPTPTARMEGAMSTDGFAAYVWADGSAPDVIKAQNVRPDGGLGASTTAGEGTGPTALVAGPNVPNPFAGSTTIRFALPEPADVTLTVHDALGRRVATLVRGALPAGSHEATWRADGAAAGVYVYRLQAGAHAQTRRMVLAP